jgi:hypothetical protein
VSLTEQLVELVRLLRVGPTISRGSFTRSCGGFNSAEFCIGSRQGELRIYTGQFSVSLA